MKGLNGLFVLLCATALAGCTHEEAALETPARHDDRTAKLTATIGADTRTYVDGVTVKWSEGDAFKAFSTDCYSYGTFVQTGELSNGNKTATFHCDEMVGEDVSELNYAVYPATGFTVTSDEITYVFPTEYTYPNSKAPMFGTITDGNVVFDQLLCGIVRITLTGLSEEGTSGTLKLSSSSVPQTATLEIDADGKASLTNISSASSTVSIDFTSTSTTQTLDIPMPVGTYEGGIDVKLDDGVVEKNLGTISGEVTGAVITDMGSKDVNEATSATITVDGSTTLTSSDLSSYTDLTITGTVSSGTLTVMKKWATLGEDETANKTLDLSDATIGSENLNFRNCTALTSVVLPDGMTTLADDAFHGCTSLESVKNSSQVQSVGEAAFYSCSRLSEIDLSGATSIGYAAFYQCTSLTSVGNTSKVATIGRLAFYMCTSLASIDLSSATSIEESAFYKCTSLTSVDLSSATSIGQNAFSNCTNLTSVINTSMVQSVGDYAFYQCSKLSEIDLSGATTIGQYAFAGCTSLTSIGILSSVTSIEKSAFWNCSNLAEVTCRADYSSNFASNAFQNIASNAVLYVPNKYLDEYTTLWGEYFGSVEAI